MPYLGIVQDLDHEFVVVKVMHKIGRKRYFWPARDDVLVYNYLFDQIFTEFDGMENVTGHHKQMPMLFGKTCAQY